MIVETTSQKRDFNKSESTECLKDSDQSTGPKVETGKYSTYCVVYSKTTVLNLEKDGLQRQSTKDSNHDYVSIELHQDMYIKRHVIRTSTASEAK